MTTALLVLALALTGEPPATEPKVPPPEIRLANASGEVEFGVSIVLDTTPSANVHQMKWSVYPEKYQGNLIEVGPNKTLFTCSLPGHYVFYGAASNASGDLTVHQHPVEILLPGQELWDSIKQRIDEQPSRDLPRPQPDSARSAKTLDVPSDPFGLRGEIVALKKELAKSNGSFNWSAEASRISAAYDSASTEILARRLTGELAMAQINERLRGIDPAVRDKWQTTTASIGGLLTKLDDDGKLPTHDRWVVACQVVRDTLGDVR